MPRIQREERGDDVQAIRRQERQNDVAENLIPKDLARIDGPIILDGLDPCDSEIN